MVAYLDAENAYREAVTAHWKPLQDALYHEIVGRIRQDDSSVPYEDNGYWYLHRFDTGDEYPVYARRAGSPDGPEQVLLDLRERARGLDFYDVGSVEVSHDNRLVAFTEDAVGRRQYTLRFKDLATGALLPDVVPNVEEGVSWAADNRHVLYVEKDPVTLLGLRVRVHELGTDPRSDRIVHEETDDAFYTSVGLTKDRRFLLIDSSSTVTTEVRYAPVADPTLAFQVFLRRERGHEYSVDHVGDRWVIRSNWQAVNFRLFEAVGAATGTREHWRELIAHRDDVLIAGFDVFDEFLAIEERVEGLRRIRIRRWDGAREFHLDSDEPAYRMALDANEEVSSTIVRYSYTSLTTPRTIYDYDLRTGERRLLQREPVLGDFDPSRYETQYLWATARDGERVPVAIVYRRALFQRDGSAPMLQYGYGAYGISMADVFT